LLLPRCRRSYKVALLNELIVRAMIKMKMALLHRIGLANIILEEMVMPELLQRDPTAENLADALVAITMVARPAATVRRLRPFGCDHGDRHCGAERARRRHHCGGRAARVSRVAIARRRRRAVADGRGSRRRRLASLERPPGRSGAFRSRPLQEHHTLDLCSLAAAVGMSAWAAISLASAQRERHWRERQV
jgi:Lipid-A-disaccharide synthetase